MKFKYLVAAVMSALVWCGNLSAQTPEEIVKKMSEQMERGETEGFSMEFNMKMPVIGTINTYSKILGDKMKIEIKAKDRSEISWTDATTMWTLDSTTGEITITNKEQSSLASDGKGTNMDSFEGISDGYKYVLEKETPQAWYITCKKLKTNSDKDDPKKMDLVVAKGTYLPIMMKMKESLVTVSFENVTIGVTEDQVTFNQRDYPNAKIIDKR